MTRFRHIIYHEIGEETITACGFSECNMAGCRPDVKMLWCTAQISRGVEAVMTERGRVARAVVGSTRPTPMMAQAPRSSNSKQTTPDQTKQRVCEPRAPFPAFSPTLSECYRPGMVRPKRVSWFHPPGGCAMGGRDVVSPEKRPYFWINVRHGYQRVCRAVVHPVCAPLTVYDTGTVTTLYTCSTAKPSTRRMNGLLHRPSAEIPGLVTASRRMRGWIQPSNRPSPFLVGGYGGSVGPSGLTAS